MTKYVLVIKLWIFAQPLLTSLFPCPHQMMSFLSSPSYEGSTFFRLPLNLYTSINNDHPFLFITGSRLKIIPCLKFFSCKTQFWFSNILKKNMVFSVCLKIFNFHPCVSISLCACKNGSVEDLILNLKHHLYMFEIFPQKPQVVPQQTRMTLKRMPKPLVVPLQTSMTSSKRMPKENEEHYRMNQLVREDQPELEIPPRNNRKK